MEEAIEIIKRCWAEDEFSHTGRHWMLRNVRVMPKPLQKPMKLLMGASSPIAAAALSALRRSGRLNVSNVTAPCRSINTESTSTSST